ncbi:MAG: hypothetical protein PHV59_12615, partial [Victivallales bacterium]|nr:hypothetical protein [Victivallales bacterium]
MKKLSLLLLSVSVIILNAAAGSLKALEDRAAKLLKENNCKEAFYLYRKTLLEYNVSPFTFSCALASMKKARLEREYDDLFKALAARYAGDPEMLTELAGSVMAVDSYGYIVAGEFVRGDYRGGGDRVCVLERDRVKALRLMLGIMPQITKSKFTSSYYKVLKKLLLWGRNGQNAWKLQYLTDVNKLPDYEKPAVGRWGFGTRFYGAPVDVDGNPVFYHVPANFQAAVNDGERWRYAVGRLINHAGLDALARTRARLEP